MYLFQDAGCSLAFFQSCHPTLRFPPMAEGREFAPAMPSEGGLPEGGEETCRVPSSPSGCLLASSSTPPFPEERGEKKCSSVSAGLVWNDCRFFRLWGHLREVFCLKNCTLLAWLGTGEVPALDAGRGREGEPEAVFRLFRRLFSSPYLQQNGDRMTTMIQTKLSFCISKEPFEQAERLCSLA